MTAQYRAGLGLHELGRFVDHEGFDGVILGEPKGAWHLEFVHVRGEAPPPAPHPEQALVVYVPEHRDWLERTAAMARAGFARVPAANPYWERLGRCFVDTEGGRVIVQQAAWTA
ncbi:hypothetical protein ATSB10_08960 [Dyella thiooxydans]|uniref:VOC domain-containing protein n=2 Tax=Dyella thiooxydans TaxID=445710 RepID=A0A160MYL0_9GAMM|nr:hypothetical protein ATSB10_08960 [Dyella thiooxydans]